MGFEKIGEYTRIEFNKGIAKISKGDFEPSDQQDAYYEKQRVLIMCKYKLLFKEAFEIDDFGVEICQYFEQMNYSLEIEEFDDGTKHVDVIDLTNMSIILRSNDLIKTLTDFDLKRKDVLLNIV